jgi:hypothetical protein
MAAGRKKNDIPTVKLEISTTEQVVTDLRNLVTTGYFGKNTAEAAEQILRERLRTLKDETSLFPKGKK